VKEDLTIRITTDLRETTMNVDLITDPNVMIVAVTDLMAKIVRLMEKTEIRTETVIVRLVPKDALMAKGRVVMLVLRSEITALLMETEKVEGDTTNHRMAIALLMETAIVRNVRLTETATVPLMETVIVHNVRLTETAIAHLMETVIVRNVRHMETVIAHPMVIVLLMEIVKGVMEMNSDRLTDRRDLILITDPLVLFLIPAQPATDRLAKMV
jgi:hypothetical protein